MNKKLWLIGTGVMSLDYAKVLKAQQIDFVTIGRGEKSAAEFESKTDSKVIRGGLAKYLQSKPDKPEYAIVSVGVEALAGATKEVLEYGVKNILVEKPAGVNAKEIIGLAKLAEQKKSRVLLAYNRRFYSSVLKGQEIIREDGGVTSFNFEFTEWSHTIEPLEKPKVVKENWFLANSSHVVDLAFFLGGKPQQIDCHTAGTLSWHPAAAIFAGSGKTKDNILFSYQANWAAPGRWGVEILTKKHRLIFRPMEKLQIQKIGSVAVEPVAVDDKLDVEFKPGLYLEVKNFIENNTADFCSIQEQAETVLIYNKIAGYAG